MIRKFCVRKSAIYHCTIRCFASYKYSKKEGLGKTTVKEGLGKATEATTVLIMFNCTTVKLYICTQAHMHVYIKR
jgi:hypothetical protein